MKTIEADFEFPVLGFSSDNDLWAFPDLRRLTKCGPRTLRDRMQENMELVDARGHRWQVQSVRSLGPAKPVFGSWLKSLLKGPRQFQIEHNLKALAPLTLQQVHERICAAMEAHPLFWSEASELEVELPARMEEVRATSSISEIADALGLDTFESY